MSTAGRSSLATLSARSSRHPLRQRPPISPPHHAALNVAQNPAPLLRRPSLPPPPLFAPLYPPLIFPPTTTIANITTSAPPAALLRSPLGPAIAAQARDPRDRIGGRDHGNHVCV